MQFKWMFLTDGIFITIPSGWIIVWGYEKTGFTHLHSCTLHKCFENVVAKVLLKCVSLWHLLSGPMLCSSTVTTTTVQHVVGCSCRPPADMLTHRKRCFYNPVAHSVTAWVLVWAHLNLTSASCFWNIEACKSILVDPKNKIMNIENEHKRSSLRCASEQRHA